MKKYDVLVVGDINPDIIMVDYERLPNPGEETYVKQAFVELGGGCANCAAGLAKLGLKVAIYGYLGNDLFGKQMIEKLETVGVSTEFVIISDTVNTGISVAFTNAKDRGFLTYTGANALFDIDNIPEEVLTQATYVHTLCYEHSKKLAYENFFIKLKRLGITSSFDVGFDASEKWDQDLFDIIKQVDIFFANKVEALSYTRKESPTEAIELLGELGNTVVVKIGKDGSMAYKEELVEAKPFEVNCVDTTGAGDSFNAGFLFGVIKGCSLIECLIIGNAVGSRSVQAYGANPGFPTLDELLEFLASENIEIGGLAQ